MTREQVRELLERYRTRLERAKVVEREYSHGLFMGPHMCLPHALAHVGSMLPKMLEFLESPEPKHWDKVMRWLGFLQGVLWMLGWYTLDELKSHNRPVPSDAAPD